MATMNVSLPELMKDWVNEQIRTGKYATSSDYVRDLIRRDQTTHEKREALIQALIEGEESGISSRSMDDILAEAKKRHGLNV